MSTNDLLLKLKVQLGAVMRGIHSDYVLIERTDLKALLDDHERLSELMWSNVQRTMEQWKKSLTPEEFKKQFEQQFYSNVNEGKICDMTPKPSFNPAPVQEQMFKNTDQNFIVNIGGTEGHIPISLRKKNEEYFPRAGDIVDPSQFLTGYRIISEDECYRISIAISPPKKEEND